MARTAHRLSLRARILDIAVRALLPLVGIGFLTSGLIGLLTFTVFPLIETLSSRSWVPAQATIESVHLARPRIAIPLDVELIELSFRYEYGGESFSGVKFGPHGGLESRNKSEAFLAAAEPGATITVWVDADEPARAMVSRKLNWLLIALCLPALLLCGIGVLMVVTAMMLWNDRRSLFRRFRSG